MTLTLRYAARSDRGLIRDGNQDSVYAGPRLLAVADGMGGMAAGDVASNIVIGAMAPLDDDAPGDALVDALRGAVETANAQLRETVAANPQMEGMGTTLTAVLFSGTKIGMVHIGDSRAYLLRDGEFAQITKDDTYVQMLVDEGRISPEEASSHPQRSLLTRALDGRDVEPEFSVRQVRPGDRYMICSDGLSGVVSFETIAQTLAEIPDLQECVQRLVQLALRGGGPDNITVIVADATDADIVESTPVVGGAAASDRGMATAADESTPAARASAALSPPRPATPEPAAPEPAVEYEAPKRRRPLRAAVFTVLLLGLVGGAMWGGWTWAQRQYYVGATREGKVAIFQGVPGDIAGLRLSSVHEATMIDLEELTPVARDEVRRGIEARNQSEAQAVLGRLISEDPANPNRRPTCPSPVTPSPTIVLSPARPATPSPAASAKPSASSRPRPAADRTTPPPTDPLLGFPATTPPPTATPGADDCVVRD
ncbi:putative serine/threonine phosphatase Ppp [Pilimelia anulata]|uniref:Serine/threonine protein phosphatase PstP n=1 Tax=Pilimelia anulata TaxID=53371 RepID=A0A8J3B6N5_9ACTN|nr:BofC C-terminal domain-containing protein [Pilimelia anulata]GGJ88648.1 putative serine/threonine phosphatase Ppp [Pilimelia anulata]